MSWIGWIIFGLIAGAIAKALRPGADPGGWLITIILGILGSIVGGWIGSLLGIVKSDSFWSPMNWILSIVGAIVLLFIYAKVSKK
ncbi:GlsB/YeaQ/YmgE family stress response membrane protein [Elizabethkingia sp. JS20170427COW]|uniref:GlsB/YeaQ/YmgE family stress response membrane protein n=1 Tax=Elizabethkingia sp. JS20170427COW TaxID=2583851 RepID=UPI001110057B|nr:GlsB/YeaQ/YmgE family stress response membrane protein [Elizabethkingia sp. JS20170427COW]QCX53541.1 GlsB/YeaQ/YmgE family stress response membrane protein [Elizabethkingia sp. JS20170427COW]